MKRSKAFMLAIALISIFLPIHAVDADIMVPGTKAIHRCVKITNIDEFPDIVFLGYIRGPVIQCENPYVIESDECLTQFYKANDLTVYAIYKDYFEKTKLENIEFDDDAVYPGYTFDFNVDWDMITIANPLSEEERYYSIAGSNGSELVLYESKRKSTYVGGIDRVQTFNEPEIEGLRLALNSSLSHTEENLTDKQDLEGMTFETFDEEQKRYVLNEMHNNESSVMVILLNFFKNIFGPAL